MSRINSFAPASAPALQALDRPARAALELARMPILRTALPAAAGLAGIAASCALAEILVPPALRSGLRMDVLRGALEALAVAAPAALALAALLGLRVHPRALAASWAIGMLAAGMMALSLAPLTLFLAAASREEPRVTLVPLLLVPAVSLAVCSVFPVRVLDTVDGSPRARAFGRAWCVALLLVFAVRCHHVFAVLAAGWEVVLS